MHKLLICAALVLVLATACDTAVETRDTGFGSGNQEGNVDETARLSGACNGLETIEKVGAEIGANPVRAMQDYDIKKIRGCLEGEIIGFRIRPKLMREELPQFDPSRVTIEVLVTEDRGFTITQGHPYLLEEPAFVDEGMQGVLTEAEQAKWIAEYERKLEAWRKLQAEAEAVRAAYREKWPAFVLSANVGDRVRAECDLFNTSSMRRSSRGVHSGTTRFEDGVSLHHNCARIWE